MKTPANAGLALLIAIAALTGLRPFEDGDLFWNLACGHWLLDHGALLPARDPFVATAHIDPTQHEWLAQLLLAIVDDAAGLQGLRALGALCAAASALLCHRLLRGAGAPPLAALTGTALWWVVAEPHVVLRPHLLAWLLAFLLLGAPLRGPATPGRLLGLFALTSLWANAHASVVLAPLYAGIDLMAVLARASWRRSPQGEGRAAARAAALRVLATAAGTLAQPEGWALLPYVVDTPAINRELSNEWWPLLRYDVWRQRPAVIAAWMLCVVLVGARAMGRGAAAHAPGHPSLVAATFALVHAAFTRRMTAYLLLPLAYAWPALTRASPRSNAAVAAVAVALALLLTAPRAFGGLDQQALRPGAFPDEAAVVLRELRLAGRLFNPDGWGGYLALRIGGGQQVFADGRWPLVGRQVIEDGVAMMARQGGGAEALFDRYQIEVAIFRTSDYLRVRGPDPTRWVLLWQDDTAVVLLRAGRHLGDNIVTSCDFYARYPTLRAHGRWPLEVTAPPGVPSPTAPPPLIDRCRPDLD